MKEKLTQQNFIDASELLNVEIAAIKAVAEVESVSSGFINDNPKILYEPFVFGRRTKHQFDGQKIKINGIDYPLSLKGQWSAKEAKYGKESIQYQKLEAAIKLNHIEALKSCSWGKFQVMGFNCYLCNYSDIFLFVNDNYKSEGKQLEIFCKFIKNNSKLHSALRNKDWKTFAYIYNGPKYYENKYDIKLNNAYEKYKLQEKSIKVIKMEDIPKPLPIMQIPPIEPKLNKFIKLVKYIKNTWR